MWNPFLDDIVIVSWCGLDAVLKHSAGLDNSEWIDTLYILSHLLLHCNNLVAVIRINYQSTLYVCVFPAAKHFINGCPQRFVVYGLLGQYIGFKLTSIVPTRVFIVMVLRSFSDPADPKGRQNAGGEQIQTPCTFDPAKSDPLR